MKVFLKLLLIVSTALVIYNAAHIDFKDPFGADSIVALITVMAGLCVILIVGILWVSKKIEDTIKKKK